MRGFHRAIYATIYVGRIGEPVTPPGWNLDYGQASNRARHLLRCSIEDKPHHVPIREDAKAFLAVIFQELVLVPLTVAGEQAAEVDEAIAFDIDLLLRSAAEHAASEITARDIVDALSRNWEDMQIQRFS